MDWLVSTLIGNTVVALVIALAALLAMLSRRPALSHVLWLLVLVKLVTPPILRVPVSLPAWQSEDVAIGIDEAVPAEAADVVTVAATATGSAGTEHCNEPAAAERFAWLRARVVSALLIAWAAGTAAYLAITVVRTRRFARTLRDAAPADPAVASHVRELADRLGLLEAPDVRVMDRVASPMVIGMGGAPVLVLPATLIAQLDPDQLRAVVAHELAHVRRRDHWVRWLEAAATALLWWHPLLWLTRRGLHEAEEQCCDAWVVWAMPDARRAYADALVTTASLMSAESPATPALPPGASGLGQFQHLRRRLVMVMHRSTRHAMSRTGKLLAAAAVLIAMPILPAVAEKADAPKAAAPAARPDAETVDEQLAAKDAEIALLKARLAEHDAAQEAMRMAMEAEKAEQARTRQLIAKREEAKAKAAADAKAEEDAGDKAPRSQIDAEIAKARTRMREDGRRYSRDELQEAEQLYQVANKQWRSPEAKASLETMVKKFPKFNRTGCAMLYLGQYSKGEERERYLKQAVEQFSDCYYGNGVQVGAFARYLLGQHYREVGHMDKGNALLKEVIEKYPKSVTHRGDQLAKIAKKDLEAAPPAK